jgi:hypothetical protein
MNNYAWCILILFLSACSLKKATIVTPVSAGLSTSSFIDSVHASSLDLDWFSAKIKGSILSQGNQLPVNANLRIRTDSIIWVSVSAVFGIEAFRMVVTPDSVKILNRLSNTYFVGNIQSLADEYGVPLSFYDFQDVLLAKMKLPSVRGSRLSQEGSIFNLNFIEDQMQVRALFNQQFLPLSYSLEKETQSFVAEYSSYEAVANQQIPLDLRFVATNISDKIDLKYSYSNIVINSPKKVHFTIPKSYVFKP